MASTLSVVLLLAVQLVAEEPAESLAMLQWVKLHHDSALLQGKKTQINDILSPSLLARLAQRAPFAPEDCAFDANTATPVYNSSIDRIMIFTSGKTGSSTLVNAFRPALSEQEGRLKREERLRSVTAVSFREEDQDNKIAMCHDDEYDTVFECSSMGRKIKTHSADVAKEFFEHTPSTGQTFIIVPVRHALTRVVSNRFEELRMQHEKAQHLLTATPMSNLFKDFYTEWIEKTGQLGERFMSMFEDTFNKDLKGLCSNFDRIAHRLLVDMRCQDNKQLWVIVVRLEDSQQWQSSLEQIFTEVGEFRVPQQFLNAASNKWYANTYTAFRNYLFKHSTPEQLEEIDSYDEQTVLYSAEERACLRVGKPIDC